MNTEDKKIIEKYNEIEKRISLDPFGQKYEHIENDGQNRKKKSNSKKTYRKNRDIYEIQYFKAITCLMDGEELENIIIPLIFLVQQYLEITLKDITIKANDCWELKHDRKTIKDLEIGTHDIIEILNNNKEVIIGITTQKIFNELNEAVVSFYEILKIPKNISPKHFTEIFRFPIPKDSFTPYLNVDLIDKKELKSHIDKLLKLFIKADIMCSEKYITRLQFQQECLSTC